jgi:hypothetical protein
MSRRQTSAADHHGNNLRVSGRLPTTSKLIVGWFCRCVIGIFCVFTILATVFHYYVLREKERMNRDAESARGSNSNLLKEAILCFSIIRTIGKFLTTKSSSLNLECISGIKLISMAFIISGHTFLFMIGGPVQNTNFYEKVNSFTFLK